NNKKAIVKQSAPSSYIYSNVEIKVKAKNTEKCFAEDSSSDDNLLLIPNYSQRKQDQSPPSY
ncbi:632_t:CDS:1, partial [Funneliformis mosseae]